MTRRDPNPTPTRRDLARLLALAPLTAFAQQQQPYLDRTQRRMIYDGPGGDEPEPDGITHVDIGYFGPADANHIEGGSFWLGASKALEEENKAGGYNGRPFRFVARWSDSPWTAGASKVIEMVIVEKCWALVGSIDGVATHLAEQVITKTQVALVDPGSTDRTVNAAMIPFMFSCLPGDPAIAAAIAPALERESGDAGVTLLRSTGHDERHAADEFTHYFATRKPGLKRIVEFNPGDGQLASIAKELACTTAVLILGNVADTAAAVRALRQASPQTSIFTGASGARSHFLEIAGAAAHDIRCPRLVENPSLERGHDYAALQCYDAVRLVAAAIRKGGLNRVRICRALAQLTPWPGAAGELRWSSLNRNARPVTLGCIRRGRLEAYSPPG